MKNTIIVSFLCLLSVMLHSNELDWVNEQIEAIKPARIGLSDADASDVKSPFIFLKAESAKVDASKPVVSSSQKSSTLKVDSLQKNTPKIPQKKLSVDAIMNKSALIDGIWYKTNGIVHGYTILEVTHDSVVLTQNNKKLVLSTNSTNRNLKFKNK